MRRATVLTFALLSLAACGDDTGSASAPPASETPRATPTPEDHSVTGDITLGYGDFFTAGAGDEGDGCTGEDGYDDIRGGAQVIVRDGAGATLALGQLANGAVDESGGFGACVFTFAVLAVPPGHPFYSAEVAGRGELSYPESEIDDPLSFTLG